MLLDSRQLVLDISIGRTVVLKVAKPKWREVKDVRFFEVEVERKEG